ncbi:MAG: hypothetical protein HQL28_02420 [Candidatus Omnitrophica bacterium]|nr:hypothetical protein [Candidatus Omnitrophota bacterium]
MAQFLGGRSQGEDPDFVSQFGLGFQMLEYDRAQDKSPDMHRGLLDMLAAMTGDKNPADILSKLFKSDFILTIRKIDWKDVTDQRKAWEAVAKAL